MSFLKEISKICFNNLINLITHKIKKFSQVKLILKGLKSAKHQLGENFSERKQYKLRFRSKR